MERNAHYALVGFISLLLFVGTAAFMVWLAGAQFSQRYDIYDVAFKGPVRGLSTGGEVFFNGIRVGEVTKLSLDREDPNKVKARIRITSDAPVRVDSRAGLEPQGVTGVNYIQISAGSAKTPMLKSVTPYKQIPVILAKPSALESLLEGGGDVLTRTVEVLDRVNRLLSEENIAHFTGTVKDIHEVTSSMRSHKELVADLGKTADSIRIASDRIGTLAQDSSRLVNGDGRRTLANLTDAAAEMKGAATDARTILATLKGPTSDLAVNGMPQLNRSLQSMQVAADSINRLASEIELNPSALVTKPQPQSLKVKP